MTLRWVGRYSAPERKLRLVRVIWDSSRMTRGGWPVSRKLAVALRPVLFWRRRECDGWRLTLLGLDLHSQESHGGRFV